ncbi:MAG: UDP-glucose:undecaprenyl-phosphate glucose-1-phosphate transferase [Bacteroidetes bacterium ADurb.Bin145]|nr:MAG: UDP-glucose:undecaprenyl-phosphate glucose-1-phosphate transferase [Bacteroidetes bacterium ADurb.Bin145]
MYKSFFKPLFDWLISFVAIIILIPLFLVVALAIKIDSPGPVFFRQERLGRLGRVFNIYKFRSMRNDIYIPVGSVIVYENDPRITRVGKFIRKTSIDELPQLFNIIKGEMSFIGPRPPVTNFPKKYDEYSEEEKSRFYVKPGLSGLVQVRQREINDWNLNIPVDLEYVRNYSFFYDLRLFVCSVLSFFRTDNIYTRI